MSLSVHQQLFSAPCLARRAYVYCLTQPTSKFTDVASCKLCLYHTVMLGDGFISCVPAGRGLTTTAKFDMLEAQPATKQLPE